ncbi:hypothetical protein H5410_051558, partial [Solanum commersonii]
MEILEYASWREMIVEKYEVLEGAWRTENIRGWEKIKLWEQTWGEDNTVRRAFPNKFRMSCKKEMTVQRVRMIQDGEKVAEFQNLIELFHKKGTREDNHDGAVFSKARLSPDARLKGNPKPLPFGCSNVILHLASFKRSDIDGRESKRK